MKNPSKISETPPAPYYAVIFTSTHTSVDAGYDEMAQRMVERATSCDGFLVVESARGADGLGITVSYWRDLEAIRAWKADAEHRVAQTHGRAQWYASFAVRIARVERAYGFEAENAAGAG